MQKVKPLAIKGDVRIGYLQQLSYLSFGNCKHVHKQDKSCGFQPALIQCYTCVINLSVGWIKPTPMCVTMLIPPLPLVNPN